MLASITIAGLGILSLSHHREASLGHGWAERPGRSMLFGTSGFRRD
jgi:hypothetical protein